MLKIQPDVTSVHVHSEETERIMLYLSQFCPNVKQLVVESFVLGNIISFKQGFLNLTYLYISFRTTASTLHQKAIRSYINSTMKHVTALPKLRNLGVFNDMYSCEDSDEEPYTDEWSEMRELESLNVHCEDHDFNRRLVRYCPDDIIFICLSNIKSEVLHLLLRNKTFPNLDAVCFYNCEFSSEEMSNFVQTFGSQLKYLAIMDTPFSNEHMLQLTDSQPTKLRAFDCDNVGSDIVAGGGLTRFIRQCGGRLTRLNLGGNSLNEHILREILENCPLVVKQGEWDFTWWPNLSPRGFYNLIDKAGPTLTHLINVSSLDEMVSNGYLEELALMGNGMKKKLRLNFRGKYMPLPVLLLLGEGEVGDHRIDYRDTCLVLQAPRIL